MRRSRRLKFRHGFSLIEVMIGCGLLFLVITGVMYWITLGYTGIRTSVQNEDMNALLENLRVAFADDDRFCIEQLKDVPLDSAQPDGSQIDTISYLNEISAVVLPVIQRGQRVPGTSITIRDMRVKPGLRLDPAVYIANIEFSIDKPGGLGPPDVFRSFPIMAFVSSGKIKSCSTSLVRYVIRARGCEIGSNGYAHYEWEHEDCFDNPDVVWIDGVDPFTAVCPANMKVAVAPDEPHKTWKVCRSGAPGVSIPPRHYTDGSTASVSTTAHPHLDYPNDKCTFAYPSDADLTTLEGKVKCVPR